MLGIYGKRAVILGRIWGIHRHPLSSIGVALDWIQGKLKGVFGQRERGTAPGVVDGFTVSLGRQWKLYIVSVVIANESPRENNSFSHLPAL